MNKVAHYLQEHLLGEVTDSPSVRRFFAHDNSFLEITPAIVAYPAGEADVRKTLSFCWQLAQRGQTMPVTARGSGSNATGAAIGRGIILVFPAHMNKLFDLDIKNRSVKVEPGINYQTLEQALQTHELFFPPYPATAAYSTVGGGLASDTSGEKSVKYGLSIDYTRGLRVVLANGEVIETKLLNKNELSHKMGLTTFEGAIYRSLDKLLEENAEVIEDYAKSARQLRNSTGYNIFDVRHGGHFDLTPLFIGSQGTLGIITEAELTLARHNPHTTLCLASLPKTKSLAERLAAILKLDPSIFDFINKGAVDLVNDINPSQLSGFLDDPTAELHLFVEFDDFKSAEQAKKSKSLAKIINKAGGSCQTYTTVPDQIRARKVHGSVATIVNFARQPVVAVPVAEDICVPVDRVADFMTTAAKLYNGIDLQPAAWGNIGDGVIRFQPMLDLTNLGDRQKLFKIADSLYARAVDLGGSISASSGDGRVRAPYIQLQYGEQLKKVMDAVKRIFDPHAILNFGVKSATIDEIKESMRDEYTPGPQLPYLPRS